MLWFSEKVNEKDLADYLAKSSFHELKTGFKNSINKGETTSAIGFVE